MELKDKEYFVTIHTECSINKEEYKKVHRKYTYGISNYDGG